MTNNKSLETGFFIPASPTRRSGQLLGLYEHKLIAAKTDPAAVQLRQQKASLAAEVKHFIRRGDFVRITTNPIDNVAPLRHAAVAPVLRPRIDVALRLQPQH